MIEIFPLTEIAEVRAGADVGALLWQSLSAQNISLQHHDILVVTSKILSKAEGRFVDLAQIVPSADAIALAARTHKDPALVELILSESAAVVRAEPHILITRHHQGWVMANAGIDRSNLGPGSSERALLLPKNPDASAAALAAHLSALAGVAVAVVISDSFGRPWRMGVVNVALGAAAMPALVDRRGEEDRDGRVLEVTQIALADMVASAAGLVTGEGAEGIPAALVRGLSWMHPDRPASALVRAPTEDLFR